MFIGLMTRPITATDGYKFSMAEAGAALRAEILYLSHRKGGRDGWHYMPVDAEAYLRSELPTPNDEDYNYLREHSYEVGASFRKAFSNIKMKVTSVPKGSWFYNREPAVVAQGTSAVVTRGWPRRSHLSRATKRSASSWRRSISSGAKRRISRFDPKNTTTRSSPERRVLSTSSRIRTASSRSACGP